MASVGNIKNRLLQLINKKGGDMTPAELDEYNDFFFGDDLDEGDNEENFDYTASENEDIKAIDVVDSGSDLSRTRAHPSRKRQQGPASRTGRRVSSLYSLSSSEESSVDDVDADSDYEPNESATGSALDEDHALFDIADEIVIQQQLEQRKVPDRQFVAVLLCWTN